jgi:xanthine dehydrogenase YagS FAD-binding subunit
MRSVDSTGSMPSWVPRRHASPPIPQICVSHSWRSTLSFICANGARTVPLMEFHRLPGEHPEVETILLPGELITAIEIPSLPFAVHSTYRKVRDRASYAFALVSVAAALELEGDTVKDVRIALGGVAHKPWRALKAEDALRGKLASSEAFANAAVMELADATPLSDNGFKIELAKRTITAVLNELQGVGA